MKDERNVVEPLLHISCLYENESSEYPSAVFIPMRNGRIVRFNIDIRQPNPVFQDAMDALSRLNGYQYKQLKRKRRCTT